MGDLLEVEGFSLESPRTTVLSGLFLMEEMQRHKSPLLSGIVRLQHLSFHTRRVHMIGRPSKDQGTFSRCGIGALDVVRTTILLGEQSPVEPVLAEKDDISILLLCRIRRSKVETCSSMSNHNGTLSKIVRDVPSLKEIWNLRRFQSSRDAEAGFLDREKRMGVQRDGIDAVIDSEA